MWNIKKKTKHEVFGKSIKDIHIEKSVLLCARHILYMNNLVTEVIYLFFPLLNF
jgi:hypothetical protein